MKRMILYCKTYYEDLEYVKRLFNSIQQFNKDNIEFFISIKRAEESYFKNGLGTSGYTLLYDEDIRVCDEKLGWLYQQVIKSSLYKLGITENYLCLDSDSYFIKDFYESDFMYNETTPYTVISEGKNLLEFMAGIPGLNKRSYDHKGRDIIEEFFNSSSKAVNAFFKDGCEKTWSFFPPPYIWSTKVWRELEEEYLIPGKNRNLEEVIKICMTEAALYGRYLIYARPIPLVPIEPLFKEYYYKEQYLADIEQGKGEDLYKLNYLGIMINKRKLDIPEKKNFLDQKQIKTINKNTGKKSIREVFEWLLEKSDRDNHPLYEYYKARQPVSSTVEPVKFLLEAISNDDVSMPLLNTIDKNDLKTILHENLFDKALMLSYNKQYDDALSLLMLCGQKSSGAFDFLKGYCYEMKGDFTIAFESYSAAMKKGNEQSSFFLAGARICMKLEDYPGAVRILGAACQFIAPCIKICILEAAAFFYNMEYINAASKLCELIKLDTENEYNEIILLIIKCFIEEKLFDEAVQLCDRMIEKQHSPFIFLLRANAFFGLKKYNEAIINFTTVIDLDKNFQYMTAPLYRGIAYYHVKDFKKAEEDLLRIIKKFPHGEACYYIGSLYLEQDRYEDAALMLKKSNHPGAEYKIASLHLVQGRVDQAILGFLKARQSSPSPYEVYSKLAFLYSIKGDESQSTFYLEKTLEHREAGLKILKQDTLQFLSISFYKDKENLIRRVAGKIDNL